MEMRHALQLAMREARTAFDDIEEAWERRFGRRYGAVEAYHADDADLVLVTSGTVTSTARHVIDQRRAAGERVGLVKIKMFRPFPTETLRAALAGIDKVAVLDRNLSPGRGGIFAEELRAALYDVPAEDRPVLFGYVLGLGGRDIRPDTIEWVIDRTRASEAPEREDLWVGVEV